MMFLLFTAISLVILHRITRGRVLLTLARLIAFRYAPEKVDARRARAYAARR